MRFLPTIHALGLRGAALALAAVAVGLVGCPKQEDFPAALNVVPPPTPSNFQITDLGATTYRFEWEISDPTDVDRYRLYLLGGPVGPELLDESTDPFYETTFGFSIEGLQFAVSAVSTSEIEGYRTAAVAP